MNKTINKYESEFEFKISNNSLLYGRISSES